MARPSPLPGTDSSSLWPRAMMIDLPALRGGLPRDGVGGRARRRRRFIGQNGQRGLEEMREIGDMAARPAHHFGPVRDEAVELAGQRRDLGGERALKTAA